MKYVYYFYIVAIPLTLVLCMIIIVKFLKMRKIMNTTLEAQDRITASLAKIEADKKEIKINVKEHLPHFLEAFGIIASIKILFKRLKKK